ncbi:hypothetical protein L484_010733 [Morus notabilis]|uniref:SAWADEE domain-containing protein n=1 Tax=Morus notabilis TaxID=981085 RepID=W9RIH5_9ROSA|nr:hypothetical protein L484_010733 [Morus notabilis]
MTQQHSETKEQDSFMDRLRPRAKKVFTGFTKAEEVRVRYVGFGSEEDEWINIKKAIRERSVPIEHSECHMVKVGDLVLCFQIQLAEEIGILDARLNHSRNKGSQQLSKFAVADTLLYIQCQYRGDCSN